MLSRQIKIITSSTVDIFYPNQCQVCSVDLNLNEQHLCLSCLYDLPYVDQKEEENKLNKLFWGRVDVQNTWTLFNYQKGNQVQDLLHLIKYQRKTKLGEFLGEKLGHSINQQQDIDFIIPVPLHPKKLRKRGFNQSTLIAKGIARSLKVRMREDLLKRVKHNPSQTSVSKFDRWDNVRNIFQVNHPKKLEGKHVLIIDDVLTTGATIEACLKQLLQVEGCKISVATLAARI